MTTEYDPEDIHYYYVNADTGNRGSGFYAVGPLPSAGVVVVSGPSSYYYRAVDEFGDSFYGTWRELVPIKCFSCSRPCDGNPPQAYEFWFCTKQCGFVFAFELLVGQSYGR